MKEERHSQPTEQLGDRIAGLAPDDLRRLYRALGLRFGESLRDGGGRPDEPVVELLDWVRDDPSSGRLVEVQRALDQMAGGPSRRLTEPRRAELTGPEARDQEADRDAAAGRPSTWARSTREAIHLLNDAFEGLGGFELRAFELAAAAAAENDVPLDSRPLFVALLYLAETERNRLNSGTRTSPDVVYDALRRDLEDPARTVEDLLEVRVPGSWPKVWRSGPGPPAETTDAQRLADLVSGSEEVTRLLETARRIAGEQHDELGQWKQWVWGHHLLAVLVGTEMEPPPSVQAFLGERGISLRPVRRALLDYVVAHYGDHKPPRWRMRWAEILGVPADEVAVPAFPNPEASEDEGRTPPPDETLAKPDAADAGIPLAGGETPAEATASESRAEPPGAQPRTEPAIETAAPPDSETGTAPAEAEAATAAALGAETPPEPAPAAGPEAAPAPASPEPARLPPLAGFAADVAGGRDLLGREHEARALAALAAARSVRPPLSIGLFGDWGSGKTFFMERMHQRVADLARRSAAAADETAFCSRVVQVRFNAWHYSDADLWASLVSTLFEALFAATPEAAARRVDAAAERGRMIEALSEARGLYEEARRDRDHAQAAVEVAERSMAEVRRRRLGRQKAWGALHRALEALGRAGDDDSFSELEALVTTARRDGEGFVRRLLAVARPIARGPHRGRRLLLLAAWVLVPVALAAAVDLGAATEWIERGVAAALGLVAWGAGRLRQVSAALATIEAAQGEIEALSTDQPASGPEAAIAALHEREGAAAEALRGAQRRLEEAERALADLTTGRRFSRFLEERSASADYRERLGLVSLVRRDFERLSEFLDPSEGGEPPPVERIVLYVDDLDRCRPDRVVAVLEAIHLLLALPLFVVVVAVDPRWLRHSLQVVHPELLRTAPDGRGDGRTAEHRATPQDYLEKIFQIPFALPALDGPGFERLVRETARGASGGRKADRPAATGLKDGLGRKSDRARRRGEEDAGPATGAGSGAGGEEPGAVGSAEPGPRGLEPGTATGADSEPPEQTPEVVSRPGDGRSGIGGEPASARDESATTPGFSAGASGGSAAEPATAPGVAAAGDAPPAAPYPASSYPDADSAHPDTLELDSPENLYPDSDSAAPASLDPDSFDPDSPEDLYPEFLELEPREIEFMQRLHLFFATPRAAKRLVNLYRLFRAMLPPDQRSELLHDEMPVASYRTALVLLAALSGFPALAPLALRRLAGDRAGRSVREIVDELRGQPPPGDETAWRTLCFALGAAARELRPGEIDDDSLYWLLPQVARYSFSLDRF